MSETFEPIEASLHTYEVEQIALVEVNGDQYLVHFNGQVEKEIDNHSASDISVQAERQVRLNSVPHRSQDMNVALTYAVGESFWTSFVSVIDYESSYPNIADFYSDALDLSNGIKSLDDAILEVVSVEYADAISTLPDANDFFRVVFAGKPIDYEIRSGPFEESHVGVHSLNITVADSEDARASFIIDFTVSATIEATWQSKTDMTDHGYHMYLEETLGEEGLAELIAELEEAEKALEAAYSNDQGGHGGGGFDDLAASFE